MECPDCGGRMIRKSERLQLVDRNLGAYGHDRATFEECSGCGARFFDPETAEGLSRARAELREALLRGRAIAEFISSEEAAAILGTSRQNLGKRRRLLYSVCIGKTNVYLARSVELLRERGDGRFPLVAQTANDVSGRWGAYHGREDESETYSSPTEVGLPHPSPVVGAYSQAGVSYAN